MPRGIRSEASRPKGICRRLGVPVRGVVRFSTEEPIRVAKADTPGVHVLDSPSTVQRRSLGGKASTLERELPPEDADTGRPIACSARQHAAADLMHK